MAVFKAVRVVVHSKGVRQLLADPGVTADLARRANAIAAAADTAAGDGALHRVEIEPGSGHRRSRAAVITENLAARKGEAVDRSLTASLGAGR
jgi:hypothetical protein